jgi:hypothetical protein
LLQKRVVIFALLCFWVNFLAGSDISSFDFEAIGR